jgi:hypothetical protein
MILIHPAGRSPRFFIDQWLVVLSVFHLLASSKVPTQAKPAWVGSLAGVIPFNGQHERNVIRALRTDEGAREQ